MRFVRTILAFAIAMSLAMLPLGASASGHATSSDDMQTSMHMAGHTDSMEDCCPDDMNGKASHYKCGMGFCCIGGAITLSNVQCLAFGFYTVRASKIAIPSDQVIDLRGGSPPFRPPRT